MSNVLVIAPHPDDETLGCGGTILKHRNAKDNVFWCIATFGNKEMGHDQSHFSNWQSIVNHVKKEFGIHKLFNLGLPTGDLDQVPLRNIIESFYDVIQEVKPEIIYVNFSNDVHSDHKIVFQALTSASKNFHFPFIKKILMYETPSETDYSYENKVFSPNYFVDITEHMDKKLEIFSLYKSEIMKDNFPRSTKSIKALAQFRGCRIGVQFAEAFEVVLTIK